MRIDFFEKSYFKKAGSFIHFDDDELNPLPRYWYWTKKIKPITHGNFGKPIRGLIMKLRVRIHRSSGSYSTKTLIFSPLVEKYRHQKNLKQIQKLFINRLKINSFNFGGKWIVCTQVKKKMLSKDVQMRWGEKGLPK